MREIIEKVKVVLEYDVKDLDALFETAVEALTKLQNETVAEYGESEDRLYAQPIDQVIRQELFDPDNGELRLSSCVYAILDHAVSNVPGTELRSSSEESTG